MFNLGQWMSGSGGRRIKPGRYTRLVRGKASTTRKVVMSDTPAEIPIDGVLDLHTFRPSDTGDLVPHYLDLCLERGILDVRIIHGKGKGVQRANVQRLMASHPLVEEFFDAPPRHRGGDPPWR